MMFTKRIFAILAMAALCGCSGGGSKEASKIEEGEKVASNPLGQMSQFAKAMSDLEKVQTDLKEMKPVDAVPFSELLAFLPEAPSGWEAEKPRGESKQMGDWKFSQARRRYTSGGKSIEVEIQDWAFQQALYAPFFLSASFSEESTEGYNKGIKLNEDPGREEYQFEARRGTLSLLAGKRFLTGIKGSGIEAAELREWLDRIDLAGLRAKAQQ